MSQLDEKWVLSYYIIESILQKGSERYTVLIRVMRPIPFFNHISAVIAEIKLRNIHFEKITNAGHCLKKMLILYLEKYTK